MLDVHVRIRKLKNHLYYERGTEMTTDVMRSSTGVHKITASPNDYEHDGSGDVAVTRSAWERYLYSMLLTVLWVTAVTDVCYGTGIPAAVRTAIETRAVVRGTAGIALLCIGGAVGGTRRDSHSRTHARGWRTASLHPRVFTNVVDRHNQASTTRSLDLTNQDQWHNWKLTCLP